ncbi:Aerotaxis receptor [Planctomycetes bacterium Poly30]|uniref:Aerotaxis receptor n=1 Tax=Saltatorellus ferox TaxID=2528018 RepID=A0A518ERE0_9BACT|nr:Aerotaxis receptor [Planctomycetes bacterium Poly30]
MTSALSHGSKTALTGVERRFDSDEILVSKTDPKGRITYANRTFLRLAQYSEQELLGAPHSIIRHPDMPGCVFQLLWDTVMAGEEIFAYVVNRSKSGDFYWVLAHVTPTFGGDGRILGYHSNRRCPSREAIKTASQLYGELRALERAATSPAAGRAQAAARLGQILDSCGQTYSQFVFGL